MSSWIRAMLLLNFIVSLCTTKMSVLVRLSFIYVDLHRLPLLLSCPILHASFFAALCVEWVCQPMTKSLFEHILFEQNCWFEHILLWPALCIKSPGIIIVADRDCLEIEIAITSIIKAFISYWRQIVLRWTQSPAQVNIHHLTLAKNKHIVRIINSCSVFFSKKLWGGGRGWWVHNLFIYLYTVKWGDLGHRKISNKSVTYLFLLVNLNFYTIKTHFYITSKRTI